MLANATKAFQAASALIEMGHFTGHLSWRPTCILHF